MGKPEQVVDKNQKGALIEVAKVFLKLGFFAFGGPVAHIAMMEKEVVAKRKWMTQEHFLDLVGATNLIPGPNSTEMTMHCGHERAGISGLFVAGITFILPAVAITGILAYFYTAYGELPKVEPFLYGIKPAVLAIIIGAIYKLGKKAIKNWQLAVIGSIALLIPFWGFSEIFAILTAGAIGLIWFSIKNHKDSSLKSLLPPFLLSQTFPLAIAGISNLNIFLVFLKIGAVLFGSGYVLIAYLEGELVEKLGWINQQQLLDAIAIGQFTPGPVLSTATFVGYQINGVWGAVAATLGIFAPSFIFVWLLNPLVPKLRKSKSAGFFLDSVNVGAVGIMVSATIGLGKSLLINWETWFIALLSVIVTLKFKNIGAVWVITGGALLGYLFHLAG